MIYLRRYDVICDIPDADAVNSARYCNIQLRVISHCDAFDFGCRCADDFVKVLIAFLIPYHIAVQTQ